MYVIELPRADVHGAFCLEHQMHAFARPPSLHWRLYSRYKNLALSGVLALCFPPLSRPIMSDNFRQSFTDKAEAKLKVRARARDVRDRALTDAVVARL